MHAEARACEMFGRPGYYVFWETANAYGSRGNDLTKEAAEALAQRIRESGDPFHA